VRVEELGDRRIRPREVGTGRGQPVCCDGWLHFAAAPLLVLPHPYPAWSPATRPIRGQNRVPSPAGAHSGRPSWWLCPLSAAMAV